MGPLGFPELIFILALALLIFGPRKLPEIGRTIGKAMGEFRRATTDLKRSFDTELAVEEPPRKSFQPTPKPSAANPPDPEGTPTAEPRQAKAPATVPDASSKEISGSEPSDSSKPDADA